MRKKIGEIAVEEEWITLEDCQEILNIQKKKRQQGVVEKDSLFGKILIQEGLISPGILTQLLARQKDSYISKFQNLIDNGEPFWFGEYYIKSFISRGGMGLVFRVVNKKLTGSLAMKIAPLENFSQKAHDYFFREVEILARIHHPNIVSILDYGQIDGIDFFVMKYLEGKTLDEKLPELTDAKQWMEQFLRLLEAVQKIHQLDIYHRDLKLNNIIVTENNNWVLFDFSLGKSSRVTKLTTIGICGTPYSMAPEQTVVRGKQDHRTDIWALGIIFYQLLTKEVPFTDLEHDKLLEAIRSKPHTFPFKLPQPVMEICNRALQKEKEHRYQSVTQMIADLKNYIFCTKEEIQPLQNLYKEFSYYHQHQCKCLHPIEIEVSSQVQFMRVFCHQCGENYLYKINQYIIGKRLASGHLGEIYLAYNKAKQKVIIKLMEKTDSFVTDYFLRECFIQKKLSHQNIVKLLDQGYWQNFYYVVNEYFPGQTLSSWLRQNQLLPLRESVKIMIIILKTLNYAEKYNIIHRNIQPENIYLTENKVKLLDLGLAKIVDSSYNQEFSCKIMGNLYFMSPEQLEEKDNLDIRTDIYSAGATLYNLVFGKPPFVDYNIANILKAKQQGVIFPKTDLPTNFLDIINKAMAPDKENRYQSNRDMAESLYPFYQKK